MSVDITTFDLRLAVAERAYPTARVRVLMEERLAFELGALYREAADVAGDQKALKLVEKRIATKEAERDAAYYVVHLRGISNRSREDITSRALAAYPFKRDLYGRDDDQQSYDRAKYINRETFAANITKIVSPTGAEQVLDEDNRVGVAQAFLDVFPESAISKVDSAIQQLRGDAEMEKYAAQDVDF